MICGTCKADKIQSEFHKNRSQPHGYSYICKECQRFHCIKSRYGLDRYAYDALVSRQSYGCAICGLHGSADVFKWLVVDHNHGTGEIRGLLCNGCNRGLGFFNDNIEKLRKAIKYLEK